MERQIITRAEAKAQGLKRYFTGKPCKHGHVAERYLSTGQCVECLRERRQTPENLKKEREYQCKRREDPEYMAKQRERDRRYRAENCDKIAEQKREYRAENLNKIAALTAKRRAAKLQRTPKWANQEDIKRVYAWALLAERATGIPHEVDHIIPLRGKNVSGLHVHNNLNPLMYWDHWGKGNSFEVK